MTKQITCTWPYMFALILPLLTNNYTSTAQMKGNHLLGDYGLEAGTQAPPGIMVSVPLYWYDASRLITSTGYELSTPELRIFYGGPEVSVITNRKILNASYGFTVRAALASNQTEGNRIDMESKPTMAFTDMYVQPVQLGWHTAMTDFVAGYAVYVPTGGYTYRGRNHNGLGMWGHELSTGATIFLDRKKTISFAPMLFYEMHSRKKGSAAQAGDIFTSEGGLGEEFYMKVHNSPTRMRFGIGAIYYVQFKATSDKVPVGGVEFTGSKDHIYAAGAEGNFFYPRTRTSISVRWLSELGARNRFEGNTLLITLGEVIRPFAKAKEVSAAKIDVAGR